MKIVPYRKNSEYRPMSNMLSLFDEFYNRVYEDENADSSFRAMAMDIEEQDKQFQILANLPGFKKEDIKISLHDNQLLIEASYKNEKEEKQGTMYRTERYSGNYCRNLLVPDNADLSKITAKMEDGVLRLNIPKKEPTPQQDITIE